MTLIGISTYNRGMLAEPGFSYTKGNKTITNSYCNVLHYYQEGDVKYDKEYI